MTPAPGVHIGVELGGTKVVVAAASPGAPTNLVDRVSIPTSNPQDTLNTVAGAMRSMAPSGASSVGIGSFGPVDLRPGSSGYGSILNTPKPDWPGVDVLGSIKDTASEVGAGAVAIDTDVGAALLAERLHGAAARATHAMYMTVGTGIGAAFHSEAPVRGANHAEAGHVWVPRHPDDSYRGSCPYHGGCLEGMASGPTFEDRFGDRLEQLSDDDTATALDLLGWYVGHGLVALLAALPVTVVVIGGGVSKVPGFHDAVSRAASDASGGYPPVPFSSRGPTIVPPALGDDAGVIGAIELGRQAASELDRE